MKGSDKEGGCRRMKRKEKKGMEKLILCKEVMVNDSKFPGRTFQLLNYRSRNENSLEKTLRYPCFGADAEELNDYWKTRETNVPTGQSDRRR
ncbi:hypothetical protein AVEN_186488-1 [Araneus ventricosus]|uniref:Uncharacterized protein n=1 Tax=Araneus ventricosus TaxID=182803 RepID=A0A4Y2UPX0_ARAVE|nr:hypothetical protein AVEN_186488-1 [Araneus ventricosus]